MVVDREGHGGDSRPEFPTLNIQFSTFMRPKEGAKASAPLSHNDADELINRNDAKDATSQHLTAGGKA
jgi:hypothetical protein